MPVPCAEWRQLGVVAVSVVLIVVLRDQVLMPGLFTVGQDIFPWQALKGNEWHLKVVGLTEERAADAPPVMPGGGGGGGLARLTRRTGTGGPGLGRAESRVRPVGTVWES